MCCLAAIRESNLDVFVRFVREAALVTELSRKYLQIYLWDARELIHRNKLYFTQRQTYHKSTFKYFFSVGGNQDSHYARRKKFDSNHMANHVPVFGINGLKFSLIILLK